MIVSSDPFCGCYGTYLELSFDGDPLSISPRVVGRRGTDSWLTLASNYIGSRDIIQPCSCVTHSWNRIVGMCWTSTERTNEEWIIIINQPSLLYLLLPAACAILLGNYLEPTEAARLLERGRLRAPLFFKLLAVGRGCLYSCSICSSNDKANCGAFTIHIHIVE